VQRWSNNAAASFSGLWHHSPSLCLSPSPSPAPSLCQRGWCLTVHTVSCGRLCLYRAPLKRTLLLAAQLLRGTSGDFFPQCACRSTRPTVLVLNTWGRLRLSSTSTPRDGLRFGSLASPIAKAYGPSRRARAPQCTPGALRSCSGCFASVRCGTLFPQLASIQISSAEHAWGARGAGANCSRSPRAPGAHLPSARQRARAHLSVPERALGRPRSADFARASQPY
jgi:hypothetical protein